jgi:ATP-binding cassette, subfamily B (MDR/TAP), member 1
LLVYLILISGHDCVVGQVLLDNVDVKTLQLKQLRDQISLMNQEPALFASTILENILGGKPDATISLRENVSATNCLPHFLLLPVNTLDETVHCT